MGKVTADLLPRAEQSGGADGGDNVNPSVCARLLAGDAEGQYLKFCFLVPGQQAARCDPHPVPHGVPGSPTSTSKGGVMRPPGGPPCPRSCSRRSRLPRCSAVTVPPTRPSCGPRTLPQRCAPGGQRAGAGIWKATFGLFSRKQEHLGNKIASQWRRVKDGLPSGCEKPLGHGPVSTAMPRGCDARGAFRWRPASANVSAEGVRLEPWARALRGRGSEHAILQISSGVLPAPPLFQSHTFNLILLTSEPGVSSFLGRSCAPWPLLLNASSTAPAVTTGRDPDSATPSPPARTRPVSRCAVPEWAPSSSVRRLCPRARGPGHL